MKAIALHATAILNLVHKSATVIYQETSVQPRYNAFLFSLSKSSLVIALLNKKFYKYTSISIPTFLIFYEAMI